MGLDMHLLTNSRKIAYGVNGIEDGLRLAANGEAIHWVKADAIHRWFVDNVQEGRDDGGIYEVSAENLVRLHDACLEVLESTTLIEAEVYIGDTMHGGRLVPLFDRVKKLEDETTAKDVLPTRRGFFPGGPEYDEWYWRDLEMTVEKLGKILDMLEADDTPPWSVHHKDEPGWNARFYYTAKWKET